MTVVHRTDVLFIQTDFLTPLSHESPIAPEEILTNTSVCFKKKLHTNHSATRQLNAAYKSKDLYAAFN